MNNQTATKPVNNAFSAEDQVIIGLDKALRSMFVKPQAQRETPAESTQNIQPLTDAERQHSIELMRINHVGEVCAQALYQGQAMTARSADVKETMQEAAAEEVDHLNWCETRLEELGGRTSLLNPLWYTGSLLMGATAGYFGDKWSLGFLEETETQVEQHLAEHLERLPEADQKSRAVVTQMKIDEAKHAEMANNAGAAKLPTPIKQGMRLTALLMKTIAAKV